ncbi:hypothetical protein EOL94_04300 [bacterium]|nr:hypothetical protein [bacterium]
MSNYISLNAKYYKNTDYKHIYEHDMRHSNVTYKLEKTQYKNFNYEFATFEDLHTTKAQIMLKQGTNLRSNENSVVEFVAALSREQTEKLLKEKDGYQKLENALKMTMQEISKKYGFTSLFYAFHSDEGFKNNDKNLHNFHAHLCFYNYDFNKKKSVLKDIKKDEWGKMQDLAAKCFQSCGLDYQRGEKKVEKGKDHLERKLYIGAKKLATQDINLYVKNTTQEIINSSSEKGFLQDKINPLSLKQNLHRELLKALKYNVMPQTDKDKIKKYDELLLQNQALKKEVHELQEIKKVAETMIQDFEEIDNFKKDILRVEQANDVLHKKIEEKDQQIEKLEKKMGEQNTTIYNLNNQIQAQKVASKSQNRDR